MVNLEYFRKYNKNNSFLAFTLAEVLITLGIIGVVAGLTIPMVVENYQKKETISKLKKIYTLLNQAAAMAEAANGESVYWDSWQSIGAQAYVEKYFISYLKILKKCNTYKECGYNRSEPWLYLSRNQRFGYGFQYTGRVNYILLDGTIISFCLYDREAIYVDINGNKQPNKFGRDIFVFGSNVKKGRIVAKEASCNNNNDYGLGCLYKIIRDGWQIKNDYPW